MISLKWMKSLTNFCWLEINLCLNCIQGSHELPIDHLGFSCGPFTKHCKMIQKFKETGDLKYIYKKIDEACFAHDKTYANSK